VVLKALITKAVFKQFQFNRNLKASQSCKETKSIFLAKRESWGNTTHIDIRFFLAYAMTVNDLLDFYGNLKCVICLYKNQNKLIKSTRSLQHNLY